jgi:hypothetical protein
VTAETTGQTPANRPRGGDVGTRPPPDKEPDRDTAQKGQNQRHAEHGHWVRFITQGLPQLTVGKPWQRASK